MKTSNPFVICQHPKVHCLPFTSDNRIQCSKLSIIWNYLEWMLDSYCFRNQKASQIPLAESVHTFQSDYTYHHNVSMPVCYQINLRFLDSVHRFSLDCCKTLDIDVDKEPFRQLLSKHQSGGNRDQILIKLQQFLVHLEKSCSQFTQQRRQQTKIRYLDMQIDR